MRIQTENPSYERDIHSKALIQSNVKELDEYKLKSKMFNNLKQKTNEINNLKEKINEIDELKQDMKEIKELLRGLVNK